MDNERCDLPGAHFRQINVTPVFSFIMERLETKMRNLSRGMPKKDLQNEITSLMDVMIKKSKVSDDCKRSEQPGHKTEVLKHMKRGVFSRSLKNDLINILTQHGMLVMSNYTVWKKAHLGNNFCYIVNQIKDKSVQIVLNKFQLNQQKDAGKGLLSLDGRSESTAKNHEKPPKSNKDPHIICSLKNSHTKEESSCFHLEKFELQGHYCLGLWMLKGAHDWLPHLPFLVQYELWR